MVSYSPIKLTVEEQVPFTPPKSLNKLPPPPPSSNDSLSVSPTTSNDTINSQNTSTTSTPVSIKRKGRQSGCGNCPGCLSRDCGKCKMCLDMIKFGGKGIRKQKCLTRRCRSLSLPDKRKRAADLPDSSSPIASVKKRRISMHRISTSSESDTSIIPEVPNTSLPLSSEAPIDLSCNTTPIKAPPTCIVAQSPVQLNASPCKSSPKKFLSPRKNSPNKFSSPRKSSPRKFLSPHKSSPLKSKLSMGKLSSASNNNLALITSCNRPGLTSLIFDSTPYCNLVHINQETTHMNTLNKTTSSITLRNTPILPKREFTEMKLGTVTMATKLIKEEPPFMKYEGSDIIQPPTQGQELLNRYKTLTTQLFSNPVAARERKKGDKDNLSLHCKIYVTCKGRKIIVNNSRYKRQSLRIKNNKKDYKYKDSLSLTSPPFLLSPLPPSHTQEISSKFGQDMWIDHYQPCSSTQVIGNREPMSQLYAWLKLWKDICLGKTPLPSLSSSHSLPFDTSFSSSLLEDEDEREGESFPTAAVISGPTGVGKTASVYACAKELGYKVLEINSTFTRTKQSILSTLREATLSHQVSLKDVNNTKPSQPPKPANNKNKGNLLSFFTPKNTRIKKVQEKENDDGNGRGHLVSLATATLVLFDEVDLLFDEECRGFWSAVYEILSTSKRPLIFTANDPKLYLYCPYKSIIMTTPTQEELALHCQALSLSHDCHMTLEEANRIIKSIGKDSRKLFNMLHFWLSDFTHQRSFPSEALPVMSCDPIQALVVNEVPVIKTGYVELNQCVVLCDTTATSDIFLQSHDKSHDESALKWWQSHVTNSLSDELPHCPVTCSCPIDHVNEIITCSMKHVGISSADSSNGIKWESVLTSGNPPNISHVEAVQRGQRSLCNSNDGLFHMRNTILSRSTLVYEVLPLVQVICKSESIREEMKTSRRFSHYLNSYNSNHLTSFLSTASFNLSQNNK